MEFQEGTKSRYVHVKNDSPIPFSFNWESRALTMAPGEVAYVPQYLADHMCSAAAKRPEHVIRVIDEREGSLEFLQSEAKRKQTEAQRLADEARKAMMAAEAARKAASKAAGDVKAAVEEDPKK